jgi:hypothetical protein
MAKKAPKKKRLGVPCSICTHPNAREISIQIAKSTPFRHLVKQFGVSLGSLSRHSSKCLKLTPEMIVQQRRVEQSVDAYKEFESQLNFAKKLRDSAMEFLSDPDDPLRMSIAPRADEIDVIYYEYPIGENGEKGKATRKKAKLSELIESIQDANKSLSARQFIVKQPDIRKFALDAIAVTDTCIDKFAKIGGLYMKDRDNAESIQKALEAFNLWSDKNPGAAPEQIRDAIATFARGLNVSKHELMLKAGVAEIQDIESVQ